MPIAMKRFSLWGLLLLLLVSLTPLQAENYLKYIVSRPAETGMLYFVRPTKAEALPSPAGALRPLVFDVTYLGGKDSLTFNCTLALPQPLTIDSLTCLTGSGSTLGLPVERLYQEPRGARWELRLSVRIPYAFWREAMASATPLQLHFSQQTKEHAAYSFTPKLWRRQQGIYQLLEQMKTY